MHKKLVLFDIDGTLLYATNTKYRHRFVHAIEQTYGQTVTLDWQDLEGATDNGIFIAHLHRVGLTTEQVRPKLGEAHEKAYLHFRENITDEYASTILPGAKEILERLTPLVHLGVLTGNYEKTAWHKLSMVGLRNFFTFGVFGHEADDRNSLAALVPKRAKAHFLCNFRPQDIYLVGDTPRDIECARSIGSHSIAIPTGKFTDKELKKYSPDLLVSSLIDPQIIKFILGKNTKAQ